MPTFKDKAFNFFKSLLNGGEKLLEKFGPIVAKGALTQVLDHLQMGDSINRAIDHPMTRQLHPHHRQKHRNEHNEQYEGFEVIDSRAPAYIGYATRDTEGTYEHELDSFAEPRHPIMKYQPVEEVIDSGASKIVRGRNTGVSKQELKNELEDLLDEAFSTTDKHHLNTLVQKIKNVERRIGRGVTAKQKKEIASLVALNRTKAPKKKKLTYARAYK